MSNFLSFSRYINFNFITPFLFAKKTTYLFSQLNLFEVLSLSKDFESSQLKSEYLNAFILDKYDLTISDFLTLNELDIQTYYDYYNDYSFLEYYKVLSYNPFLICKKKHQKIEII